jgi:hypothetical protein
MNSDVLALAVTRGALYAGGIFTTAGDKMSAYVAEARLVQDLAPPWIVTTNANFGLVSGQFGFNVSASAGSAIIIQASDDFSHWTSVQTNVLTNPPVYFADPQSTNLPRRFYRAKLLP